MTGVLGWSPNEVWAAGPSEIYLALDAYIDSNTPSQKQEEPPTPEEMEDLRRQANWEKRRRKEAQWRRS